MFGQPGTYFGEFLAESNVALSQEDERNQLGSLLNPLIWSLQNEKRPITAYTLARSFGAPSRLAFFCEYTSFVGQAMQNLSMLSTSNYNYFLNSLAPNMRAGKDVDNLLEKHSEGQILTMQIALMNQKLEQLRLDTIARYTYTSRFLGFQVFHRIFAHENSIVRNIASAKTTLAQYMDTLAGGFSYATVGLPVVSGIAQSVKEQSEVIDTSKIQWSMLESICRNISFLVRTSAPLHLALFLKEQVVSDTLEWFALSTMERSDLALSDTEIIQQIKQIREKVRDRTRNDIEYIVLPEQSRQILKQLVEWASLLQAEQTMVESRSSAQAQK